jgi:hypothetical protein
MGDMIPRNLRSMATGCIQFFVCLFQAFLQILAGLLYAFVPPQLPFLLLAAVAVPFTALVTPKVFEPEVKEV